jgi:hypothetical protein
MFLHYITINNRSKEIGGAILRGGVTDNQNYLGLVNVVSNYETNGRVFPSLPREIDNLSIKAIPGIFAYDRSKPITKGSTLILNQDHVTHGLNTTGTTDMSIDTNIHARTKNSNRLDTTAIRTKKYSIYTGKFDDGYPVVSQDDFGNDVAAVPTRSNPGLLSFTLGSSVNTQQYMGKTG